MILKKPYGLLIKHFKLIHFVLTLLTIFLLVRTKTVLNFFVDYVINDYSVTIFENMSATYVNGLIYLIIFLIFGILIALFVLLRYKKKPNNLYLATMGYYMFLFVMLLVASALIKDLEINGLWETAAARQFRDFAQIIYWPQLIFIFLLAGRSLGFNVKKFNFKDDLRELELSEADSELIEINLGFDLSKVKRVGRRSLRELIYYLKENKFVFYCFVSVVSLVLVYFLFTNIERVHYRYRQGSSFTYNNFKINIEDSIITNLNYDGTLLRDDKYYLVVKFNILNNGRDDVALDYNNFKIYMGNRYYYPVLDEGSSFIDYAKPYMGEKLFVGENKTYLMTYVFDKKYVNRNFKITIYKGASVKKKNFTPKTITVKLNPVKIDGESIASNSKLGDETSFGGSYLNNTRLTINDFQVGPKYTYKYQSCSRVDCKEYDGVVTADYALINKKTLLVLDYIFEKDEKSLYYDSYKDVSSFITHFIKVRYEKDGESHIVNTKNVTPINLSGKMVLELSSEIEDADKLDLYIRVRNKSFVINLKK